MCSHTKARRHEGKNLIVYLLRDFAPSCEISFLTNTNTVNGLVNLLMTLNETELTQSTQICPFHHARLPLPSGLRAMPALGPSWWNNPNMSGLINTFHGRSFRWLNQFVSYFMEWRTKHSISTASTPQVNAGVRHPNTPSQKLVKSIVAMNDPIYRREFDAHKLMAAYPPRLNNHNKQVVFEMSSPRGANHSGKISVARWRQMPLPDAFSRNTTCPKFELREDYFTYDSNTHERCDWYLNFAHYDLFCAYGGPLFAQDEMQVTEHPALGSLRHALLDSGDDPLTVENGVATPILIMGVERRCVVATDINRDEGRPYGLYGNHFSRASEQAIRQATRILNPPTTSNIIAMEAPACGNGRYTREQIEYVLSTTFTGFRAAVYESRRNVSQQVQTAIHTGYWGCGAYGGNRELMPLLQMIAACCSDIDVLIFHTGGDSRGYAQSVKTFAEILPTDVNMNTSDLLARIEGIGYTWGVSDGN